MASFWRIINQVIKDSDIILEVLDARDVENTRNKEVEDKVLRSGKKLIFVLNKSDLVDVDKTKEYKKRLKPCVFMSAKDHLGTAVLRETILKNSGSLKQVYVGVLGYPNTGKSTVINSLAGGSRASTSSESGHTKGKQNVRISRRIKMIDTPGVIPYREKDNKKHGLTGSIDYAKIKDAEDIVYSIIEENPGLLEQYYDIKESDDPEDVVEQIAFKFKHLRKGGIADLDKASRMILRAWQKGDIKH